MTILYNKRDSLSIEKLQKVIKKHEKILREITKKTTFKKQKTSKS